MRALYLAVAGILERHGVGPVIQADVDAAFAEHAADAPVPETPVDPPPTQPVGGTQAVVRAPEFERAAPATGLGDDPKPNVDAAPSSSDPGSAP